jgi:MFS family permease
MSTFPSAPPFRAAVTAARRPRFGPRLAVVTVTYAFVVAMLATTLPSPLYELYRHQFGFSELMVTVIFAIYGVGVIAALLVFGRLSDEIGRRRVLLGALVLSAAGMTALLLADDVPLLLLGRFLSGLSAGLISGAATAALIDLTPPARRARATLVSTIAQMGGLGVGPLLAGVVATWIVSPLRTPFWIVLGLLAIAVAGVWAMPEPGQRHRRLRLRPQSLTVPPQARPAFVRGAPATFAGFAVLGLFAALSPALLGAQLAHPSPALVGVVVAAVFFASTVGELFIARVPGPAGLLLGYLTLIAGMGFRALSHAPSELMGLDQQQFIALLDGGPLGSPYAVDKLGEMTRHEYPAGFPVRLAVKDLGLVREVAESTHEDMPLLNAAFERMSAAAPSHGDDDLAAVYELEAVSAAVGS